MPPTPRFLLGVSTKMYFSHARTVEWCRDVAALADGHPAVRSGHASLFVVPGYLSIPAAVEILDGVAHVGAQDLAAQDSGAFTGEVSGAQIAEAGCSLVEIGHAERRRHFGEDDAVVRAKTAAALRAGLTPLLCIGEAEQGPAEAAARECIRQIDDAVAGAAALGLSGRIIAAYEPHWAIGAPEPAPPSYITAVCSRVREHVRAQPGFEGATRLYGGSAGPGRRTAVAGSGDGLFLGRFAHDPRALGAILDDVTAVVAGTPAGSIRGAGGAHV